jgi:hypothetical protein
MYICWWGHATDEYRAGIRRWRGLTDEYMGPAKVKLIGPYIHQCSIKIDEYKFIFIGFKTEFIFISFDEYNLNIFIRIDKFKNLMNDIFL